jgi:hypothetical protein
MSGSARSRTNIICSNSSSNATGDGLRIRANAALLEVIESLTVSTYRTWMRKDGAPVE